MLLGISAATKIYAAVLIPLLVIRTWRTEGRRRALWDLGLSVGSAALVYLPFFVLSPHGTAHSVWRQLGRGLQLESLGSGVLLAFHHAFGMGLGWTNSGGSQNLTGTVASVGSTVTTILGALALLRRVVAVLARRRGERRALRPLRRRGDRGVRRVREGALAAVPGLAAAVGRARDRPPRIYAMAFLVAACAFTRAWFPWHYVKLVTTFDSTLSWFVLLRDLALVGIFLSLVAWRPALRLPSRSRGRQRPDDGDAPQPPRAPINRQGGSFSYLSEGWTGSRLGRLDRASERRERHAVAALHLAGLVVCQLEVLGHVLVDLGLDAPVSHSLVVVHRRLRSESLSWIGLGAPNPANPNRPGSELRRLAGADRACRTGSIPRPPCRRRSGRR